jgi:hypothetical protein
MAMVAGIVALVDAGAASAQVPGTMNFQGLLLYPSGAPRNGNVTFVFELFTADTGGAPLWTETLTDVPVLDGIYDVVLGATTPLTSIVSQNATLFLQITVSNPVPLPSEVLAPRRQLLVVPYAIRAETASTANTATTAMTAGHATSADTADTALDVGGVSAEFFAQVYQYSDFDGNGLLNSDPIEGLAYIDADGLASFIDPDNDGDGLSDATEISQGSNPNQLTPTLTGFSPPSLLAFTPSAVTVLGTQFDLLANLSVQFGAQGPQTPANVTPTSFVVGVAPQPAGIKPVVISSSNGETIQGSFEFLANPVTAFVTSTTYNGNLGGLAGADAKCQARADAAALPDTYLAWIRTSSDTTRTINRWTGNNFALVTGTQFAINYDVLVNVSVHSPPLNRDEIGNTVPNGSSVWTGGGSTGGGNHCSDWASSSGAQTGTRGTVAVPDWETGSAMPCNQPARLYCFKQ